MKLEKITFNLFYPKLSDIRRKFLELEEELCDYFVSPFNLLPIPDDAPPEIPRITAKSKHGHSQLSISLINVQINIDFDENFNRDFDECFKYMNKRIRKVIDIFSKYSDGMFIFSGITTKIMFDELYDDPIKLITDKFVKLQSNVEPYRITNKFTYLLEDKYFVNIDISNLRVYEGIIKKDKNIKPEIIKKRHWISVVLDVNDKYAYNHVKQYYTNQSSINRIIEITKDLLYNKINKVIEGGVLEL